MSPTSGSSAAMTSAISCFVAGDGSKLSPASASPRRLRSEAVTGAPSRNAPSPEIALNVSPTTGSCTTASARSSSPGAVLQGDAHGPGAGTGQVVPRAVERIDDPAPPAGAGHAAALLAEHAVVREGGAQTVDDQGLAGEVDVRHEVVGVRLDRVRGDARPLAHLQCACLAGEADGQVVRRTDVRCRRVTGAAGPGCAATDRGVPCARPARRRAAAPHRRRRRTPAAACPAMRRPRAPGRPSWAG